MFTATKFNRGGEYGTAANPRILSSVFVLPTALVRLSAPRRTSRLYSWPLVRLTFLVLAFASPAMAAEGPSPSAAIPAAVWWVGGLIGFMSFVQLCLSIWEKVKFTPPLHRQFAALTHRHDEYAPSRHDHPEYLTESHFRNWRKIQKDEHEGDVENAREMEQRLAGKLDDVREALGAQLLDVERRLGSRIDPMAETLAATKHGLNQHLEDHRARRIP